MSATGLDTLRETRRRLMSRQLGESATLVIASIGDSWTSAATRWTGPAAQILKDTYGDAGPGWVGFGSTGTAINGNVNTAECVTTHVGTWNVSQYNAETYAPDLASVTSSTAGSQVKVTRGPGSTTVRLFAKGTADGRARYQFNGGGWTTLSLVGSGLLTPEVGPTSVGQWSLEIEVVSGTVTLMGLDVQSGSPGVRWHKIAGSGTAASTWAARLAGGNWNAGLAALAPNLVLVLLGTNDQTSSDSAATFKANVQTLLDKIHVGAPTADILLIAPCENQRGLTPAMSAYATALSELATTNACAFLDLQPAFGTAAADYAAGSTRPWFASDGVHPDPLTGGRAIVAAVLAAIEGRT